MIASEQVFAAAKVHFILDLIDHDASVRKAQRAGFENEIENKIKTEPGYLKLFTERFLG